MEKLTIGDLKEMFNHAYDEIKQREDEFSQLDAIIGDGDHGTAIVQAMKSAIEGMDNGVEFKQMLNDAGFNVMLQTSGSTSTLMGAFLLGMSDHVQGDTLCAEGLKGMFRGGLEGIQKQTKAAPGDKTMMDALCPAVDALTNSSSTDIRELLSVAAEAAREGAEATVNMKANFGRARNYGEKSIGYADSGASSWACMFEAFSKSV